MILPLLLAQAAFAAKSTVLASKSFPAGQVSRIEIHAEAGDIRVTGKPGKELHVDAVKPADSEGHCELKLHLEGSVLELEAKKPAGGQAVCDGGFVVTTPPAVDVEAYTGSGDVEVSAVHRTLKVRTGSGDARVTGVKGQAYVMTGSGKITASLPSAAFDARTGSGDIAVTLTSAGGLVSARAGSGSITVTLPRGAKAHVTASTASGKVTNPLPDTKAAPLVVEAFTGSGDVTIATK